MKTKNKITQSKLAAILGITRQTVAHHQKSGKAPPIHDVDGWAEFLAVVGREGSLPSEIRKQIAQERLRLIRGQAERIEVENRIRTRELIEWKIVAKCNEKLIKIDFFGELDRLKNEWPSLLKGKSEIEICETVGKEIEQIKANLEREWEIEQNNSGPQGESKKTGQAISVPTVGTPIV